MERRYKNAYMFMAGRFLFNINNNDKYSKIFSQEGFDFMINGRENTGNNELDEKEKEISELTNISLI